jgi:hypothetical protein
LRVPKSTVAFTATSTVKPSSAASARLNVTAAATYG